MGMNRFARLAASGGPHVLPCIHDALAARIAEQSGMRAFAIGGAAVAMSQLALPDNGLQSFGEFRDSVARIRAGSGLPVLVDGEDGYGDAKAVVRTTRTFASAGVDALQLEDLVPLVAGEPIRIAPLAQFIHKLALALDARGNSGMWIVGRTDIAHAGQHKALVGRARAMAAAGVDAILATGLRGPDDMKRLRDAVDLPLVAIVADTKPWFAPTLAQVKEAGFQFCIHPTALLLPTVQSMRQTLAALKGGQDLSADCRATAPYLAEVLRGAQWNALDTGAA